MTPATTSTTATGAHHIAHLRAPPGCAAARWRAARDEGGAGEAEVVGALMGGAVRASGE